MPPLPSAQICGGPLEITSRRRHIMDPQSVTRGRHARDVRSVLFRTARLFRLDSSFLCYVGLLAGGPAGRLLADVEDCADCEAKHGNRKYGNHAADQRLVSPGELADLVERADRPRDDGLIA